MRVRRYTLCGVSVGVTVLFEVPIFFFAPWILARFSKKCLFIVAHMTYVVRVIGYTLAPNVRSCMQKWAQRRWWCLVVFEYL